MTDIAQISVTTNSGLVTVVGGGILDFTNSQQFGLELSNASSDADSVIVDLRGADFIDTQIVQYLGKAAVRLLNRGKRLRVIILENAYPLRVLRISGYHEIMDIEIESVDISPLSTGDGCA